MIQLPPDFREFLKLLNSSRVEYLVIGGYAVNYYGFARATADLDIWIAVQTWLFATLVSPVLFWFNLMEWYEPAFGAVEFAMLGVVQIAVIALVMRLFERRWPLEKGGDERLVGVDRVYTLRDGHLIDGMDSELAATSP